MLKETALMLIRLENEHIDFMFNETLKECFGKVPEKISLSDWFKFNRAWESAGVYKEAKAVQKVLRDEGYDVRINMQTYKLSYQGVLSYA